MADSRDLDSVLSRLATQYLEHSGRPATKPVPVVAGPKAVAPPRVGLLKEPLPYCGPVPPKPANRLEFPPDAPPGTLFEGADELLGALRGDVGQRGRSRDSLGEARNRAVSIGQVPRGRGGAGAIAAPLCVAMMPGKYRGGGTRGVTSACCGTFTRKGLSDAEMVRELIAVEAEAYMCALVRTNKHAEPGAAADGGA